MNRQWLNFFFLFVVLVTTLIVALPGHAGGGSPPKFGTWKITAFTGEFTVSESGRYRNESWTFAPDTELPGGNWIRVYSHGDFEYRLDFKGVKGSPHPSGLTSGGSGKGAGGKIHGHNVMESEVGRSERTITGTYSETVMEVTWTTSGSWDTGRQKTEHRGTATLRAVRGAR